MMFKKTKAAWAALRGDPARKVVTKASSNSMHCIQCGLAIPRRELMRRILSTNSSAQFLHHIGLDLEAVTVEQICAAQRDTVPFANYFVHFDHGTLERACFVRHPSPIVSPECCGWDGLRTPQQDHPLQGRVRRAKLFT